MDRLVFEVLSAITFPKVPWSGRKAIVLVSCTGHEQQRCGRLCSLSSYSLWAYEGEVEQWVEDEVERELSEMAGSLEQLAGLEE